MGFMESLRLELMAEFPDIGPVISEGSGHIPPQESLRGDLELIRKAVALTPNTDEHFPTREAHRDFGYAIKAALPDDPQEAFELFREWSARWTGGDNDPDYVEAEWGRYKPPYRRGASYVYETAERASRGAFSRAEQWFDPNATAPLASEFGSAVQPVQQPQSELRAGRVNAGDLLDLPPRQWLYGYKVSRRYVTFLASPGGVGKTAFTFAMGLAAASHLPLLHDCSRKPLKVWFYNLEDDIVELRRRLAAAIKHYGLDPAVLDNIRLNSGRDRRFRIVQIGRDGSFIVQPDYRAIIDEMIREGIDILFVDPFLRSHGVPENENEAQDEVMRLYAQIAEETNAGIVLVHHTKKGAVSGDLDSMRGGSTQGGGARAAFTLSPMTTDDAVKLGIQEAQRRLYVRLDDAKNNMAPPASRAEWLKLESVGLGNGTEEYPHGDSVQVATKWDPPSAWENMAGENESAALARIEAGPAPGERYSPRPQDRDRWVGKVLVEEFDKTPAQARELLDAWTKQNTIEVRDYHSPSQRKDRKGVFVNGLAAAPVKSIFD